MSVTVCIAANTLSYPEGGGHLWVYLNWALGLRALGCKVIWLELIESGVSVLQQQYGFPILKGRLGPYNLDDSIALVPEDETPVGIGPNYISLDEATDADLLLNFQYSLPQSVVNRFRRSALIDIDPGLLQIWISSGSIRLAHHDFYFTTGETVARPQSAFPDAGLPWQYIRPCVALDWWQPTYQPPRGAFTTISHWYEDEWVKDGDEFYRNDKRTGFEPFLDLPTQTRHRLELALCLSADEENEDAVDLRQRGWSISNSSLVASTPWDYQTYIRQSIGEFSCAKPSCTRLQNAWISDRTICYLASAKPAVVQHTGQSRFLPDAAGLFRFRTLEEAKAALNTVVTDYDQQCKLARSLAEEYFDAEMVLTNVLEIALN